MDAKALAKSKRAHSQHHSKKPHHSAHKPKAASIASEKSRDTKKPLVNQVGEKAHQSRRVAVLPSNWDRYDEVFDLDSENPSGDGLTSQPSDAVVPKSKGADYRHLIAEAQAESDSKLNLDSASFPSLDDVLPDEFSLLVGSMVSARGEGILSWIGDDNFVVEDGKASNHEAAFLSLNLNALAEQLEKVELHRRLFIEADLLPPELCADGLKANCDQGSCQQQTAQGNEDITKSKEPTPQDFSKNVEAADESIKPAFLGPPNDMFDSLTTEPESNPVNHVNGCEQSIKPAYLGPPNDMFDSLTTELESNPVNHVKDESSSNPLEESLNFKFNVNSVASSKKKFSTFEASSAEAELDMLLDAFDETKVYEPLSVNSTNASESAEKEASKRRPPQHSATNAGLSAPAPTANFDDVLDDLLEQTSTLVKPKGVSQQTENQTSSSQSVGKSKLLDDFDSWLDTI